MSALVSFSTFFWNDNTTPEEVRKRLYEGVREMNFARGSIWPTLASKATGTRVSDWEVDSFLTTAFDPGWSVVAESGAAHPSPGRSKLIIANKQMTTAPATALHQRDFIWYLLLPPLLSFICPG